MNARYSTSYATRHSPRLLSDNQTSISTKGNYNLDIPVRDMIHGQHRVLLDDAVVLRQVLLGEARLVARAAERLAEQFALPV